MSGSPARGIRARAPRRHRVCPTGSRHSLPTADNLLDRNFAAGKPDRIWLADITCIATGEGWLLLAAILDLFTRKIVGRAMREYRRAELTMAALTHRHAARRDLFASIEGCYSRQRIHRAIGCIAPGKIDRKTA